MGGGPKEPPRSARALVGADAFGRQAAPPDNNKAGEKKKSEDTLRTVQFIYKYPTDWRGLRRETDEGKGSGGNRERKRKKNIPRQVRTGRGLSPSPLQAAPDGEGGQPKEFLNLN